jgi:small neutral amino acid transporter SnatA (MarC family)
VGLIGAWVLALGLAGGVVGLPERCPDVTPAQVDAAAVDAVSWFARNQLPDGRWVYRYNLEDDVVDRQPHTVRHSGVTMSLYQAHRAGIPRALEVADAGAEWSLGHLLHHDDWAAVAPTAQVPTGGTALLVAGLSIRRAATDDDRYDHELRAMGRFLVTMTEPSGAVLALWDPAAEQPVPDRYSAFYTGETYFALGLLANVDSEGPWRETADRIGAYLATQRDEVEEIFPPASDHWAAYGLATSAVGSDGALSSTERAYARRLAGIFGVEVRYESQRTGEGLNRWVLRGPRALGAGLGTLGEGLGALWRLAEHDEALGRHRDAIGERLRCVAGMLVDRQMNATEAANAARADLVRGAWFSLGWTQMDDQQHALSALLVANPTLAQSEAGGSSEEGSVGPLPWLVVIAVAAVNPLRVRRLNQPTRNPAPTRGLRSIVAGSAIAAACLAAVSVVADPLLRAIDVSPPTALIAAGLVVGLTALVDFVRPHTEPWHDEPGPLALLTPVAVPGLLRPAAVLLVLAVAADVRIASGLVLAGGVAACGLAALVPATPTLSRFDAWAWRALAALAILGAADVIVDGVFAI